MDKSGSRLIETTPTSNRFCPSKASRRSRRYTATMTIDRRILVALLISGVAVVAPAQPDSPYTTGCVAVDANIVEGFVTNSVPTPLHLDGTAQFHFLRLDGTSRPSVSVPVNIVIPSGQAARVARARIEDPLIAGETCRLDVSAAAR